MNRAALRTILGSEGASQVLGKLQQSTVTSYPTTELANLVESCEVADAAATVDQLLEANLLYRRPDGFGISRFGIRTALLLEAIHGGDLQDVWRRLTALDPGLRTFELIRNQLTTAFLTGLSRRPGFRRLFICSPWISLNERQRQLLMHAVIREADPEILVITRPNREGDPPRGVKPLLDLGATVFCNRSLHTKLYIREPDASGGALLAILGSQNLTKSTYLELGIQVHGDSTLVQNLIKYFFDVCNESVEYRRDSSND